MDSHHDLQGRKQLDKNHHDLEASKGHVRSGSNINRNEIEQKNGHIRSGSNMVRNDSEFEKGHRRIESNKGYRDAEVRRDHQKLDVNKVQKESKNVKSFKSQFKNSMMQLRERVESRANESGYSGGWRDGLAGSGFGLATTGATAAATLLGIAGAITAAATAGATLAVAAAGIGAVGGYNVYRTIKKKREFKRALNLLQTDDLEDKINKIADMLAKIYRCQLSVCSPKDAKRLAVACYKPLKNEMLKNKYLTLHDLMHPANLQAFIVKSASHVKKKSFSINGSDKEKTNTRDVVKHATLYCHENKKHYSCKKSQPSTSGVLFFKTKRDLELCKLQIEKIKKDKWHYEEMSVSQVKHLERNYIFNSKTIVTARVPHSARNDDSFSQLEGSDNQGEVVTSSSSEYERSQRERASSSSSSNSESTKKQRASVSSSSSEDESSERKGSIMKRLRIS